MAGFRSGDEPTMRPYDIIALGAALVEAELALHDPQADPRAALGSLVSDVASFLDAGFTASPADPTGVTSCSSRLVSTSCSTSG